MAIDSANKRFSMMNFGIQPISPLFIPDGTVDAGDKYHMLTLYYGISLSSPTEAVTNYRGFIVNVNRMGLR